MSGNKATSHNKAISSARQGFTLVEVLIALVVLALATILLADTFGASARNVASLKDTTAAWRLASNKLVELQVYQQYPSPGVQEDQVEYQGLTWLVRTRISQGPYPDTVRADIEAGQRNAKGEFASQWGITSLLGKPFTNTQRVPAAEGETP